MLVKIFVFLLGAAIGSFINVIVLRRSKKENFAHGRSRCPNCKATLKWYDLVPVFSFVFLKGRCRYCNKKISWQYPIVEFVSGLGFVGVAYLSISLTLKLWVFVAFAIALLISVYDLKYLIIPDVFLVIFLAWVVFGNIFFWHGKITIQLLSGLLLGVFFLGLFLVSSGRWIGGADVKIAPVLGFWVGWPNVLVLFLVAYLSGATVAAGLLLFKKAGFKSQIAFGPFLLLGAFVAFLWADQIIKWYTGLL